MENSPNDKQFSPGNQPEIKENSVESEVILDSSRRVQDLEGKSPLQAAADRAAFNLGSSDTLKDAEEVAEALETPATSLNISNQS